MVPFCWFRFIFFHLLWPSNLHFYISSANNAWALCQSHKPWQNWTGVKVVSLGRSHIKHHESLDVWKLDASQVHLKLPDATLVGNDLKLSCWGLHGGHSCHTKKQDMLVSSSSREILTIYSWKFLNVRQYKKKVLGYVTGVFVCSMCGLKLPCPQLAQHWTEFCVQYKWSPSDARNYPASSIIFFPLLEFPGINSPNLNIWRFFNHF